MWSEKAQCFNGIVFWGMPNKRPTGENLQRAILKKARHLLVTEGYNSLSIRKIAREAGCSPTSIYLHFENKDALIHALIDEGIERLHEELEATIASSQGSPVRRLTAMSRTYVEFGLASPEYYQIMFQLHPERMARYPAESYRRARRNLERYADVFEEGQKTGVFRDELTPIVSATALWTALHGLVSLFLSERVDVKIADESFIDAAIAQAIRGFLA